MNKILKGLSSAIIIRDDVDDSEYVTAQSEYPAVFPMATDDDKKIGECSATLISKNHAVTAAHCFEWG